jgi:hypothetical protein
MAMIGDNPIPVKPPGRKPPVGVQPKAPESGIRPFRPWFDRFPVQAWLPFLTIVLCLATGAGEVRGDEDPGPARAGQPVFTLELWDEELRQAGHWFPLGSRVVARISCRGLPAGRHELYLTWFNPQGREMERTPIKVIVPAAGQEGKEVRTSAWLKLHQGLLARTFGLKKGRHLGRWEVRLLWRGREVGRTWFVLG